jgi:hypothetical protein
MQREKSQKSETRIQKTTCKNEISAITLRREMLAARNDQQPEEKVLDAPGS